MKRKILLLTLVMMLLLVGHSFSQSTTENYIIDVTGDPVISVDSSAKTLEVIETARVIELTDSIELLTSPAAINVKEDSTSGAAIKADDSHLMEGDILEISGNDFNDQYSILLNEPIKLYGYSSDTILEKTDTQLLIQEEIFDRDIDEYRDISVNDLLTGYLEFNYDMSELTLDVVDSQDNVIQEGSTLLNNTMTLRVMNEKQTKHFTISLTDTNFGLASTNEMVEVESRYLAIKYPYDYTREELNTALSGDYTYDTNEVESLEILDNDSIEITTTVDGYEWLVGYYLDPYLTLENLPGFISSEDEYDIILDDGEITFKMLVDEYAMLDGITADNISIEENDVAVSDLTQIFDANKSYELKINLTTGQTIDKDIRFESESGSDGPSYDNSDSNIEYLDIQFIGEASHVFGEKAAYLKAKQTYEVDIKAYDVDDTEVPIDNISINVGADFGTDPTFEEKDGKYYLTTHYVSGGYGDSFWGSITVNDYETGFKVDTYEGKLLLLDLTDVDGNPYSGWVSYHISYALETGDSNSTSGTGSSSNGVAYNGVLPIPIQGNYIGVNHAYIIAAPEDTIEMANTKFIDLTNALDESITKDFVRLDEASAFQEPEFTGTVYTRDEEPWSDIRSEARYQYLGDDYDMYSVSGPSAVDGNQFVLASIGEDFSSTFDISIGSHESGQIDIDEDDIALNIGKKDFVSPNPEIEGQLLDPRTNDLIKNGHGRDTRIYVYAKDHSGNFDYGTNNANFILNGFENGKAYELHGYIEPGDFIDENLTDTETYEFTYDDSKETIELRSIDTDDEITMTKDADGIYQLDLYATESIVKGRVFKGSEASPVTTNTNVVLYDEAGDIISRSYTTSSQFVDEDDNQGYFMLGGTTIEPGTYYIEVEAPIDSINYTDYREKIEITSTNTTNVDIILPESKIYGNIVGDSIFESVRNVYVNIFDAFGNYLKNGRVRADGKFAVGNLDAGRYYSKVFVSPYSDLSEEYTSSKKVAFEVTADERVNFDVPLTEKMYEGTLLNNERENWIRVFDENMNEVEAIKSDEYGKYNIPVLDDGEYFIRAYGHNKFDSMLENITVINGELSGLDNELALSDHPNIEIDLVNTTGNHLNGEVIIYNEDKKFVSFTESIEGKASLGGLATGTYFVEVKPFDENYARSEFIEITIGETLNEKTIELSEASMMGTINSDAGWVYLLRDNEIVSTSEIVNGNFSLPSLQSDVTYEVYGVPEDQGLYETERKEITSTTESLELVASEVSAIRGIVTIDDEPIEDQVLYLYDAQDQAVDSVKTNMFGEFYFNNIPSGNYKLVVPTGTDAIIQEIEYSDEEEVINLTL